jgi:RNA polymerase sigma-70 factor (ECF subfamily)
MVYTVAARQTGDLHLADEIAQSVFLILSRKARGFSSRISIPGWLLRTTRFVCLDAIKMRRRRAENEQKLAVNLEHQHQSKTEPTTMELLLDEAIQALRPDEQAGIVARFFEGRDFQEIAEMFAISEHAARKRTSRCLAKLQAFMEKRRTKVTLETLSGLLIALPPLEATKHPLQSAIQAAHEVWKGKVAAGNAVALANHAMHLLRWRFFGSLTLKLGSPALVILVAVWFVREWNRPVYRLEKLGKAWAALDNRIAQHRQWVMQTPPSTPNYRAKAQEEFSAFSRESARITSQLKPWLAPPNDRDRLARFLTAGLAETLNLNRSQRAALLAHIQDRLAQGATLNDAMKSIAQDTEAETTYIKAILSPEQRQLFDKVYGVDGVLLFSYPKVIALKRIG